MLNFEKTYRIKDEASIIIVEVKGFTAEAKRMKTKFSELGRASRKGKHSTDPNHVTFKHQLKKLNDHVLLFAAEALGT